MISAPARLANPAAIGGAKASLKTRQWNTAWTPISPVSIAKAAAMNAMRPVKTTSVRTPSAIVSSAIISSAMVRSETTLSAIILSARAGPATFSVMRPAILAAILAAIQAAIATVIQAVMGATVMVKSANGMAGTAQLRSRAKAAIPVSPGSRA